MDTKTTAVDAILASGKQLAIEIEQDVAEVDSFRPNSFEMAFRFRLRHIRETLRKRTKECLDYELSGAELLFEPSSGGAMESAKVAMLQAQRDTLRRLLDALNGAVAELRGSYDSRMTNLTNLMILVLTLASIFLAFRSLKVAQVTLSQATSDAADSAKAQDAATKAQDAATKRQLEALQISNDALKRANENSLKQEGFLSETAAEAKKQGDYLAAEQVAESRKQQEEKRRELADMLLQAAQNLKTFYGNLENIVQNTGVANNAQFISKPDDPLMRVLEERYALATAMGKTAQLLRESSVSSRASYLGSKVVGPSSAKQSPSPNPSSWGSNPHTSEELVEASLEETSQLLSNYNLQSFYVLVSQVVEVLVREQALYSLMNEEYLKALTFRARYEAQNLKSADYHMIEARTMSQLPDFERSTKDMVALWGALRESIEMQMAGERKQAQPVMLDCQVEPAVVSSGRPVLVTSTVLNVLSKQVKYTWTSNGGKIAPSQSAATISTEGLTPGSYTVQGVVSSMDQAQGQSSCTAAFRVREFQPPVVECSAIPASAPAGTPIEILAKADSPENRPLTYSYTTTAGHIEGVGPNARLKTDGMGSGTIKVTCSVVDDRGQSAISDVAVSIDKPTSSGADLKP